MFIGWGDHPHKVLYHVEESVSMIHLGQDDPLAALNHYINGHSLIFYLMQPIYFSNFVWFFQS